MWPNPQESADLVAFTEEIVNGKTSLLCSAVICKIFEKLIFMQKKHLLIRFFSKCQCGFRKGLSDQDCFFNMLEIGEVLMTAAKISEFGHDLSKAFDCISQAIITAKFNAYVMFLPCLFLN